MNQLTNTRNYLVRIRDLEKANETLLIANLELSIKLSKGTNNEHHLKASETFNKEIL